MTVTFTVDAGGGRPTCTAAHRRGSRDRAAAPACGDAACRPGTAYTVTVTASNAAGQGTTTRAQGTDPLYGAATCINGPDGDQRTYCDADVDGRNGNEIFIGHPAGQRQAGRLGAARAPGCRRTAGRPGENVDAWIYNNQKQSTWWVQVDYAGPQLHPLGLAEPGRR